MLSLRECAQEPRTVVGSFGAAGFDGPASGGSVIGQSGARSAQLV